MQEFKKTVKRSGYYIYYVFLILGLFILVFTQLNSLLNPILKHPNDQEFNLMLIGH